MKRVVSLLLLSLMFFACVPTPEEEIVVGKANQADMIEAAKFDASDFGEAVDLRATYHIPERMTGSYTSTDGVILVSVDAEIVVPAGPLPIKRVYAAQFEQPTVTALWNELVKDAVLYNRWEDEETKADIEKDLKTYSEMLDQIRNGELDEREAMYDASELTEMIDELKARYADAPDGFEKQIETGVLHKQYLSLGNDKRAASRMGIMARSEGEPWINFSVANDSDNTEPLIYEEKDGWSGIGLGRNARFYYNRSSPGDGCCFRVLTESWIEQYPVKRDDPIPAAANGILTMTPEAAYAETERFLKATGLDDVFTIACATVLSDRDTPEQPDAQYAYYVELVRTVDGAPCARSSTMFSSRSTDAKDERYSSYWGYENLSLYLDDTGIFFVDWTAPITVGDTVLNQTALMDFPEIQKIAERMLPMMEVQNFEPQYTKTVQRTIDRIELGLWRITEQNELGNGLLVPVYCFYGTDAFTRTIDDDMHHFTDETVRRYIPLIINAVNGSVIDPDKGY